MNVGDMIRMAVWSGAFTCISMCCCNAKSQQADFFWSLQGLNQGAVNAPLEATFEVGQQVSLYLYYSTNGPSQSDLSVGALLDITTSRPGVIEFVSAESFDFPVSVGQIDCSRWAMQGLCGSSNGAFGPLGIVSSNLINEWGAFTFTNMGIREANSGKGAFLDQGYDAGADAFLFGKINFVVLDDTRGSVRIATTAGRGLAVNALGCEASALDLVYSDATVHVANSVLLGDVNMDDSVDLLDVAPFSTLIDEQGFQVEADINQDGSVDLQDVSPFVALLLGSPGPENPPAPSPQAGLRGDVNCDGIVNMIDGSCLATLLSSGAKPCDPTTADVNLDGEVNLNDFSELIKIVLLN